MQLFLRTLLSSGMAIKYVIWQLLSSAALPAHHASRCLMESEGGNSLASGNSTSSGNCRCMIMGIDQANFCIHVVYLSEA